MKRVFQEATRAKSTVWYIVHRVWKEKPSRLALDLLHKLADRWKTAEGNCITAIKVLVGDHYSGRGRERCGKGKVPSRRMLEFWLLFVSTAPVNSHSDI